MFKILEKFKFNESALSIICVNGIIFINDLNSKNTCCNIRRGDENLLNRRPDPKRLISHNTTITQIKILRVIP